MISIILPVYNSERYLRESIQSILDQTYTDFEFIIINDGSTDHSESIILSFNDDRIRYFSNEMNKGLIFTLNKGVELSKRKYIARMDSDDIAYPKRLELQLNFLENNLEYGVCGSLVKLINEDGKGSEILNLPINDDEIKSYLYFSCPINHPSVLIRTSLLRNNLYSEDYKTAEDYELWIRLSSITKFYNLPNVLLNYRVHSENISKVNIIQAEQSVAKILRKLIEQKLSNKSLIDIYIGFVIRSQVISFKEYDKWLVEFVKESIFSDVNFKKYFIKRWLGICISAKNYRYIVINNLIRKEPLWYTVLLIRYMLISIFKGLPISLKK